MDGGRDSGSVECAETPLFSIKGFGFPLLFIYSPTVIKETAGWNIVVESKGSRTVNKKIGEVEGGDRGKKNRGKQVSETRFFRRFWLRVESNQLFPPFLLLSYLPLIRLSHVFTSPPPPPPPPNSVSPPSTSPSPLLCWGVLPHSFCSLSEKWSCVPGGGSN